MNELSEKIDLTQIESRLGYNFCDTELLVGALTRRSFWHENRSTCSENNERMEFLGDAVLGLTIANILYKIFPDANEGDLQKKRASIVNRGALARLMRTLGLAQYIRMGKGDEISGCRDRDSILADTLEAIIAAIYIDSDFNTTYRIIERLFSGLIQQTSDSSFMDDCKSRLQELTQAQLGLTPFYEVLGEWGEEHKKTFSVAVYVGENLAGSGEGASKREAAQVAARNALAFFRNEITI
ncbi:MAG: ribonuclease III [Desulfomonilaceae bacterium]